MNSSKVYYGETTVNIKELIESNKKGFIRLEYYGIKSIVEEKFTEYGIEIVKKEYANKNLIKETNNVTNIAENEEELEKIIEVLKRNKVTPIGLEDIIKDLVRDKMAD